VPSNIALTEKMLAYARRHKLQCLRENGRPIASVKSSVWGRGKRALAWRVSGHLHAAGKHVPQSQWKTAALARHFFPMTNRERFLTIVKAEIGVSEWPPGSNSGNRVREYLRSAGIYGTSAAWCACFVNWCLHQFKAGVAHPSWPASCTSWVQFGAQHGLFRDPRKAQPGDLLIIDYAGTGIPDDHICVCASVFLGRAFFRTVGGNEGNRVTYGTKSLGQVYRCIDLDRLIAL